MARVTKLLARWIEPNKECPFAKFATMAAENVQPVPWVFTPGTRAERSQTPFLPFQKKI